MKKSKGVKCILTSKYFLGFLCCIVLVILYNYLTKSREGYEGSKELLLVHMNGCGHCDKLMPKWKQFVAQNKSGIKTRAVEMSKDKSLVKKYKIQGYPTILLLGKNGKKLDTYDGPRTVDGLLDYCNKN